jgi:ABC-type multidrug transport system ATPase subunit
MSENRKIRLDRMELNDIGKKFADRWVLRHISLNIKSGDRIAIEGPNGSGKSTLLQIMAGYISPTAGKIRYYSNDKEADPSLVFKGLSLAAPYMDVIEDFTLEENIRFFVSHKPLLSGIDTNSILSESGLQLATGKAVRHFSSGMKQRLKLALAFFADTDLLFLDEPLSNLDESGYEWYKSLVSRLLGNRMVVVCTNQVQEEAFFCPGRLRVTESL